MLNNITLENILFLDIETVPQHPSFDLLNKPWQELWERKASHLKKEENETAGDIYNHAGIYAEFGKIICISVGIFSSQNGMRTFRIKSFFSDDEKELLLDFAQLLNQRYNKPQHLLCGHNGKEFDFPYLSRRMLVNGIKLPDILNTATKKPWEVQHLDTMELWKFGDYKSYTPLNLLALIFNIPSPKDDIDGSMVWKIYWQEKDLKRIVTYCQKDVITVAQIILKYRLEPLLSDDEISIVH
jgi:3'-5' exonuclease